MVQYYSGPNESVMAENTFMCKWHMTTVNAVRKGSRYEISKHGMAKAVFSAQNKLTFVELAFDVMSFMQQLRRSSGKFDFLVRTPFSFHFDGSGYCSVILILLLSLRLDIWIVEVTRHLL